MDFEPGQSIGDYEILRVLGAGGMGKVYQVRNTISNRIEAMKVLLPDLTSDPDLVDRFLREIRISASLDHPNIAMLRTAQRIGNQLVMVMEYVEGSTLDQLMRQSRIPVDQAVAYTSQALSALSYAHSKGVTHRDIKPANIMLTPAETVKLMDFGIARLATDRKLTKTGMMVGSVYYMSPEQIEGRELDARSDIYSLGITLYEIATGQRPFNGDSEYQIMAAHLKGTPQPPRELDATLPPALNDIILMALAKDQAQRFQSADAFRAALASLKPASVVTPAAVPVAAAAAPPPMPPPAPKRDRRLLYMLVGSVATIAVFTAAVIQVPKYWKASAVGGQPAVIAPISSQTSVPTPVPLHVQSAPQPTLTAPLQQAPNPEPPSGKIAPAVQAAQVTRPPLTAPAQAQPQQQQPQPQQQQPQQQQAQPQPTPQIKPTQQQQTAQPVPTQAPPAVDQAGLSEVRDHLMQMGARVGAVNTSLQALQSAQAQQGVGLRSDMVAAQQRMLYQMNEAESNLRQNNAAAAKKRLEAAERDLEKLETFLGK